MKAVGLIAVVGIVAAVVAIGVVRSQPAPDPWSAGVPGAPGMAITSDEQAILNELDREKFIKARELAQKLIAKDKNSFIATYALAIVHHEEEGNHARALFHIRAAEKLLYKRGLEPSWHIKVLREESAILSEMDNTDEQIRVLDRHARLYPPGNPSRKIWPLLKEKRYDEAKKLAEEVATSEDANERLTAHNGLLTVWEEQRLREEAFQAGRVATEHFPNSCIIHRNAGILAWERFKPQVAEEWLLHGTNARDNDCGETPFTDLAWHYLLAGEVNQAVSALKKANGVPIAKRNRARYVIMRRALLADLLHVLGKPDQAERLAREVYEQPERTGTTSNSAAISRLTRTMRYWLALDAKLNYEAEKASYRGIASGITARTKLALERWEVRRALFQLSADEQALLTITRPNLGDFHIARWTTGGLVEILGSGVMQTAVANARALDAKFPEATPYLDALEGEIAYRTDDLPRALELADKALAGIPSADGLIRWYVMAWQADARWREGDHEKALAGYHEVLLKLPSALRILDLALPVTITHDGSGRAEEAADAIADSPRFEHSSNGFQISLTSQGKTLTACLSDKHGMQFACASSDKDVETALDAFHAAAFSPKVAVTQADLNSLDGNTSSRTADQVLEGLLDK
jgi:hypothetical protein